ncbi:MAG TPA: hypothetical protein VNX86_06025 [Rhizomicrobium sp.]|nr:hypothetical protein [Rhizomicrobium sp.]
MLRRVDGQLDDDHSQARTADGAHGKRVGHEQEMEVQSVEDCAAQDKKEI